MEFCLLGPLAVRCDGAAVLVPPGKQRAVLAALLLAGGRVVPADELSRALWGAAPPASARVSVQNYVRRLRQGWASRSAAGSARSPAGTRSAWPPASWT
jgi:DNA-binding SARP family transcriptional activator